MKETLNTIGGYRLAVDGAMILTILTLVWHVSGWTRQIENSVEDLKATQSGLVRQVQGLQKEIPDPNSLPITAEADRRLEVIETRTADRYRSIDARLTRIEKKLDQLN